MKNIFSLLLISLFATMAMAQVDRSKMPEPGKAPEIEFGKYKVYELDNGLKVIVVEDHKLPRLTMSLTVDRDPIFEGEKAGYVTLAGQMLRQGTTNRPKEQLDEEVDYIGASLSTSSSFIFTSGLSKYNEKLMEIMADVALNPSFPVEEFEKLKKQQISGIQSSKDDPDQVAGNVFGTVLYGKDHPYGEMLTIEKVESVELEDCKQYYQNYWIPNQCYLTIVGDIKPRKAKKMAKKYFGDWEQGNIPRNTFTAPATPDNVMISLVNKDNAVQSVLRMGNTIDLKPGDPDIVKLELANQILGVGSKGRLFQNIREDKGYTYGAYSDYDYDKLIGSFTANASVRNEVTDSAIAEFFNEFNRIRTEPVTEEELEGSKNFIIGSFGRSLESPNTVASFALNIQRYNLPEDYYENYLSRLQALTTADVMEVAKKYIKPENMHITLVGKANQIADKVEKFGPIQYYDEKGNKTEKPSIPVPEGVTAQMVIDNYIKALGGKEKLESVKDLRMKMNAEVAGAPMQLSAEIVRKRPNKYKMEITATGMGVVQKQVFDGTKGTQSAMGQTQSLQGEELEEMKAESTFNKEMKYLQMGYELNLDRMAMVDGKKAYVLEVTSPAGSTTTEYYDAESGYKIKEEQTVETPQGEMVSSTSYADYTDKDGFKYAKSITVNSGQVINMTVTEVKVNSGVKDSEFAQ